MFKRRLSQFQHCVDGRLELGGIEETLPSFAPASVVLQELHDRVPSGHFTLEWLTMSLRKQSYGAIILLLAVIAIAPGISLPA